MKKLFSVIMLLVAAMIVAQPAAAQSKVLNKALKKEYKTKMKELKKEGWKVFGTARSLDVALLLHYEKLNNLGDNAQEITGVASSFSSKNVGDQWALTNACNRYARLSGSKVKARIVNDMAANAIDPTAEFDKFYAAYEALVEKEIKNELQPSFSIIRENKDKTYELQSFYIVNEDAASKARIRAWENAMKESEAAQKYATKVSDFIKEGFKIE